MTNRRRRTETEGRDLLARSSPRGTPGRPDHRARAGKGAEKGKPYGDLEEIGEVGGHVLLTGAARGVSRRLAEGAGCRGRRGPGGQPYGRRKGGGVKKRRTVRLGRNESSTLARSSKVESVATTNVHYGPVAGRR